MSAAAAPASRRSRLLIVDDEAVIVHLIRVVAQRLDPGLRIESCDNGAAVQACAEQLLPDLMLLDLKMPGADGFEVLRRLRAAVTTRDIPVVVMTGLDTEETVRRVAAGSAAGLLRKPLEVPELRAVLREHLRIP